MIEDRIKRFVVDELHGPSQQLTSDYPLIERGIVDSLGIMNLVSFVEAEYGITIDDEDLIPDNFESIRAIAALVESKTAASAG